MELMRSDLSHALMRASTVPVLLFAGLVGLTVPTQFVSSSGSEWPPAVRSGVESHAPVWKSGYSVRFPGCVATVLWPADETPRAVVVRRAGRLSQVTIAEAVKLSRSGGAGHRVDTVGLCR